MSAITKRRVEQNSEARCPISKGMSAEDAVRFAIANTVIEGGRVLPETEDALDRWAAGELSDDQLIEFGRSKFGPRS